MKELRIAEYPARTRPGETLRLVKRQDGQLLVRTVRADGRARKGATATDRVAAELFVQEAYEHGFLFAGLGDDVLPDPEYKEPQNGSAGKVLLDLLLRSPNVWVTSGEVAEELGAPVSRNAVSKAAARLMRRYTIVPRAGRWGGFMLPRPVAASNGTRCGTCARFKSTGEGVTCVLGVEGAGETMTCGVWRSK